jgi:hypothetical protein
MTLRVIYIFRGLQVYVLSTSKRLPIGSPNADIYPMSQPLAPPEKHLRNKKNMG